MKSLLSCAYLTLLTLVFLFVLTTQAFATEFYAAPVTGTATGTSTKVMNQNNLRTYLIIQNTGANVISVKFGSVQSGTEGLQIAAGGAYEPIEAPANSIYLISLSSTSAYTIIQGN